MKRTREGVELLSNTGIPNEVKFKYIEELPDETLLVIIRQMTVPTIQSLAMVNQKFRNICKDQSIWDHVFLTRVAYQKEQWNLDKLSLPDGFKRTLAYYYAWQLTRGIRGIGDIDFKLGSLTLEFRKDSTSNIVGVILIDTSSVVLYHYFGFQDYLPRRLWHSWGSYKTYREFQKEVDIIHVFYQLFDLGWKIETKIPRLECRICSNISGLQCSGCKDVYCSLACQEIGDSICSNK